MISESQDWLKRLQKANHPECVVCGAVNDFGLGLEFRTPEPGVVEASFDCRSDLQGYEGVLHGGVICMLLDGAMTNCLFAQGRSAVTAEMQVRFRHPVQIRRRAVVRAWVESSIGVFQVLQAEVRQDDRVMATATGKFFDIAFASQQSAKTP